MYHDLVRESGSNIDKMNQFYGTSGMRFSYIPIKNLFLD